MLGVLKSPLISFSSQLSRCHVVKTEIRPASLLISKRISLNTRRTFIGCRLKPLTFISRPKPNTNVFHNISNFNRFHHQNINSFPKYNLVLGIGIGIGFGFITTYSIKNNLIYNESTSETTTEMAVLEISKSEVESANETPTNKNLFTFQQFLNEIFDQITTSLRLIHLILLFLPVLLSIPIVLFGSKIPSKSNSQTINTTSTTLRSGSLLWYKYFTWTMELAGPSFIKLGQWAASRTDIFPELFCQEMSKLHSNARAHSLHQTKKIICKAFNNLPFEDIFEEFIETPLGVGAMAQVYKAKLSPLLLENHERFDHPLEINDNISRHVPKFILENLEKLQPKDINPPSDWVVIKVLHPNVEKIIERDLKIMKFFANLIDWIPTMEWLSLPDEVDQFALMMRLQLNLRIEAENLLLFRRNFADRKDILFPEPYINFSTNNILIEEFISGLPMTRLLRLSNGQGKIEKEISDKGLDSFLKMLLIDNFIHSDLHPGNIYVKFYKKGKLASHDDITSEEIEKVTQRILSLEDDPKQWETELDKLYDEGYRPQVCFIDAGLVTELNQVNRRNFIDLFKAIATFDGYRVGELMVERSKTPETAIDSEIFYLKAQRLVRHIKERTFALGSVKLGDLLGQMLGMVRQHHVRMEGDFITVVLSILLLEGIGRQLDPDIDLFKSAIPILRLIGPSNQETPVFSDDSLSMIKVWLTLEVRQFINASIQDIHNLVRYDRLCHNE